jgi:K+-transporting ATPase ATPase C chain
MTAHLRPALVLFVMLSALTGLAYPAFVTGVAQVFFPSQANGSLMTRDGNRVVGSTLIGQTFSNPRFFWSRPSAIGYAASTSSGTNLGPSNPALRDAVKSRIEALRAAGAPKDEPVPADLVTASGSGLDPHISVAAARYQAARVARARGLPSAACCCPSQASRRSM